MQIAITTEAAPGRVNEDYAICGPNWAAIFDGATPGPDVDGGCVHDVPWLVRQLAGNLAPTLVRDADIPLTEALASAIATTTRTHENTCDLENPDSPSSTVAIARCRQSVIDYLVLADSPILIRRGSGSTEIEYISDDRSGNLPSYTPKEIQRLRNSPAGFWVASTQPEAAANAVTGSVPGESVEAVYLLTDGIGRFVDLFGLGDWAEFARVVDDQGGIEIVSRIRATERERLPPMSLLDNGRRLKQHDDATVISITIDGKIGVPTISPCQQTARTP
jgi:hypothetical protein